MEEQIRKLAEDFAEGELRKRWEGLDYKNPDLLKDILKESANIGIFSFLIDEEIGGSGFNLRDYCIFLEKISEACAGIGAVFVSHLMGITPILLLKDTEKRDRFLSIITESEKEGNPIIFTLAIYEEKFSKLIPDNIQTIIKPKNKNYILSGNKINVLCAEIASYFTLLTKLENSEPIILHKNTKGNENDGIKGFSGDKFVLLTIPSNSKGIEIKEEKDRMGLKVCPINDIYFHNVEIPQENILDEDIGLSDLLNYHKFFDAPLGAIAIGMAEEGWNIALKYTTERYQGGKIICEHDAIKMMLSDMALSIEAAKNFVYPVRKETPPSLSNGVYNSSNIISSAYAVDIAERVCIDAIQLLGGYGYMKDFKIEQILRDAKTYQAIINPMSRKMEYINCEVKKIK